MKPSGEPNGPTASTKIASPANTPEEQVKTLGGMPPEKNEKQIFEENSVKSVPGTTT